MIYILPIIFIFLLIYGPQLWVTHILKKHHKQIDGMPGTGGELANHLIERFELIGVKVEEGKSDQDYYSPDRNVISLSPEVFQGKSLSAVAVAAHEVGHAIQFNKNEPISQLRGKYLKKALIIQNYGVYILMSIPVVGIIFRIPHLALVTAVMGVITMIASVLMYVAILPEEYDASFKKALPILEEGYVPEKHLPAIRQVLKACALTYVASALADILRLWRWLAIIK